MMNDYSDLTVSPQSWCLRLLQWGGRGEGGARGIVWGRTTLPPRPLIGPPVLRLAAGRGWSHTQVWPNSGRQLWWASSACLGPVSPARPEVSRTLHRHLGRVREGKVVIYRTFGSVWTHSLGPDRAKCCYKSPVVMLYSWLTFPSMQVEEEAGRPTPPSTTSRTRSLSSCELSPTTPSGSATPSPSPVRPRTSRDTRYDFGDFLFQAIFIW